MGAPVCAVFGTKNRGRTRRLVPVVEGLARAGCTVHALVDMEFAPEFRAVGGHVLDLYGRFPIEQADRTSWPAPVRLVTHAAYFAEPVRDLLAGLGVELVVYDGFSVLGWVVAQLLGVPRVHLCPGHNQQPARRLAALAVDPRLAPAPECLDAVRRLSELGIAGAGPTCYVATASPDLNLYGEPPEFLRPADRAAFEPIAYMGSLALAGRAAPPTPRAFPAGTRGVYVSFGTVMWLYYRSQIEHALAVIEQTLASSPEYDVLVSLGGHESPRVSALARPGFRVERAVDQWAILSEASAFVTHHGLASTHEAIHHGVPMLSCPLASDQPELARRCAELGLAIPLASLLERPLTPDDMRAGLAQLERERAVLAARLAVAQEWERRTIAGRPEVIARILALVAPTKKGMTPIS